MDYTEVSGAQDFKRNMRRTPWLKLFPHWWSENDPLLNAIGDEVERIKALAFFALLNAGIKPPVMIWQNSLVHKEHHIKRNLTHLTNYIDIQAPLYKTWGKITLRSNTKDDIDGITIMVNQKDGILIDNIIHTDDVIVFDVLNQKLTINDESIQILNVNDGIPYFKTVQNKAVYDDNTPLHNEVIRLEISSKRNIECNIDVDIQLDNVVFTNEQNIEITSLELIPIEKVELFVKHDFDYNPDYNGWHKVYRKKYDGNTNVLYDMITTQFYTKEFYVHVWFKELQYPYKVGFPCYQDAEPDSMYHVNNRLDTWGEQLGLQRRNYKKDIDEKLYYKTFPEFYPFDIEQDYWYYRRLTNEYTWNHLSVNDVDIKDTKGNNVIRLYSINPFVEDFVVHAKSRYSEKKELKNKERFTPVLVSQQNSGMRTQQVAYVDAKNILKYDDRQTKVTLSSRSGNNINKLKYQSKELWSFFDLSSLPEDIKIENIEILVEGDSRDNKKDKYSTPESGLIIESLDGNSTTFIPLYADKSYQLSEQLITYSSNELLDYLEQRYKATEKEKIEQTATIGYFSSKLQRKEMQIPFKLEENGELVTDFTDIWVYYDKTLQSATYVYIKEQDTGYIKVGVPYVPSATKMTIVCKSKTHSPFTGIIDIGTEFTYKEDEYNYLYDKDEGKEYIIADERVYLVTYVTDNNGDFVVDGNGNRIEIKREKIPFTKEKVVDYVLLQGPFSDGILAKNESIIITDDWHTQDIRNVLQKQGLFFRNIFENNNEQSETTINVKNVTLQITYSEKRTSFTLDTQVDTSVSSPLIAKHNVTITNIGEKVLSTGIDIITPPNIQLSQNYINITDLAINESHTTTIDVYPQSPIEDGYYDILTVCEGKSRRNRVGVFNNGLIDTGVRMTSHHGKYNEPITLRAYFSASGDKLTDKSHIRFYVNNYIINEEITLENNVASITFTPQDYSFIDTGLMPIDVKYEGSEKYAPCSARNELFISKSSTKVKLDMDSNVIPYASKYTFKANVTHVRPNGEEDYVTDGEVSFYLDDIPLGKTDSNVDGCFTLYNVDIDIPPGYYTLWARYGHSQIYATDEDYMQVRVSGGKVNINVFDSEASPVDTVNFKAKVVDDNGDTVEAGCIKFSVQYENLIDIEAYGKIVNGIVTASANLNVDIGNKGTINATIKANLYEPENNTECDSAGYVAADKDATGFLTISKHEIDFVCQEKFFGTQYEPLGFIVDVIDKTNNKPVEDGTFTLEIIGQNDVKGTATVNNGKARIVINPTIYVENWDKTSEFNLFIDGDEDSYCIQKNGHNVNLRDEYNNSNPQTPLNEETKGNLFLIAEVDRGYSTERLPFEILLDGTLEYHDYDLDEDEMPEGDFFFYLKDRDLYRVSSTQSLKRTYKVGTYELKLSYNGTQKYKSKTLYIEDGLVIEESDIDLDLHVYNNLTYVDENPITCYTTYRNNDENVTGNVDFYIDNEFLCKSKIENKKSLIPVNTFKNIPYGERLLEAKYHTDNGDSYTYTLIQMGKVTPTIDVEVTGKIKGQDGKAHVIIKVPDPTIIISGFVHLYLNDEIIQTLYLYGNEGMQGIVNNQPEYTFADIGTIEGFHNDIDFIFRMPDDIDINTYKLKVEYEGNDLVNGITSAPQDIHQEKVPVHLLCTSTTIAKNEQCFIPITVEAVTDPELYDINEGYISVIYNNDTEVSRFGVSHGQANIQWTPVDNNYAIKYVNERLYYDNTSYTLLDLNINVIEQQKEIEYNNDVNHYASLRDAIQCLQPNGTLIIENEETLDTPFEIKKPVTIKGIEEGTVINLANHFVLNSDIKLYNLEIVTDNNSHIVNRNKLKIIHSILRAQVQSMGELAVNRCLVYNRIDAVNPDLNNNWWGQNDCPYKVDSHIILTLDTDETPAVIVDDINVHGRLVGTDGVQYSIPSTNFMLTADTGLFSIDSGSIVNEEIRSTYLDAEEEGKIYLTVDNQTVECDVYDYSRKTEIIIDPIYDIPVDYYVSLRANIRSCTDNYYDNSKMNGYVDWYIDGQQIGHSYIVNNYSTIKTYMNDYSKGSHTIKAVYKPYEYYFGCSQEIEVNVIDTNKVIYVSATGYDTEIGHGTFDAPYATISRALNDIKSEGYTIYLQNGEYTDSDININYPLNIKGYSDNATFTNAEGTYIFNNNSALNINRINFVKNKTTHLFNNSAIVNVSQSLIQDNVGVFANNNYNVEYSAILKNEIDHNNATNCWYGDDTDVKLGVDISKNIIYEGIVALLTAKLVDKDGNKLQKALPSRIAQFISNDYSLRPIEDYTYSNNKASSLLDTHSDSNKEQPVLTILDTTQYIHHPVNIRCKVQNGLRQNLEGTVHFLLVKDGKKYINEEVNIENGYATLTHSPITMGEYELSCTYDNGRQAQTLANVTVKKQDIQIKDFVLTVCTNHKTGFTCRCLDSYNNPINNLTIDVLIGGQRITQVTVVDGQINVMFEHKFLTGKDHILTLRYYEDSEYETLQYDKILPIRTANTDIVFTETSLSQNVVNDLEISINDEYNQPVIYGTVTVYFDGDMIVENASFDNGKYILTDFVVEQKGQHSLTITYNGYAYAYNSCSRTYTINTDIYNIHIKDLMDFDVDLNENIVIDHDVQDISSRVVSLGVFDIYLNDIILQKSVPIEVGHLTFKSKLPTGTKPGTYTLKLYYKDDTDTYLDTLITRKVTVRKIDTSISVNSITSYPNQDVHVPFSITSKYGRVSTGILEVSYESDDIKNNIYTGTISDGLFNYITFTAPNLPAGIYTLNAKYIDTTGYYKDANKEITLNMQRNNVVLEPNYNAYYPQKPLMFTVDVRNQDGRRINTGAIDIYLDGVKVKEDIPVNNGQASTELIFYQAKTYQMDIAFKDEEYYLATNLRQDFLVGRLNINQIAPIYNENKTQITSLDFDTVDDYNVTDGIVYIFIDDIQAGSYYIKEKDKIIDLNIDYLTKGEHEVTIKYSDSMVFADYENTYDLNIEPKQATINIPEPINVTINSHLTLYGTMSEKISGTMSFKIDDKYIGSTTVNADGTFSYDYDLPITFTNREYNITATFSDNPYYDTIIKDDIKLILNKRDLIDENGHPTMSVSIDTTKPQYQTMLQIAVNTELSNPSITFYIKNLDTEERQPIGRTTTKAYTYYLDNDIVKNENGYQIVAEYGGSPIYNPITIYSETFNIIPYTPTVDNYIIHGYINGNIILPQNIFVDGQGNSIDDSGNIKYIFDEDEIEVKQPLLTYKIAETYSTQSIPVHFISKDTNKYNNAEDTVQLALDKNHITLTAQVPEYFNLNEEFVISVEAQCDTTQHNISKVLINEEEYTLTDNTASIQYTPSQSEDLRLVFQIQENNIFYGTSIIKVIPLNRGEYSEVSSTDNIQDAINTTVNGGTLIINENISNTTLTIKNDLNIKGSAKLSNCLIKHESNNLLIEGLTLDNCQVDSDSNLTIKDCNIINSNNIAFDLSGETNIISGTTFKDNKNTCIKIDTYNIHTTIDKCMFNHNNASSSGVCIQSVRVNELNIQDTQFINNNNTYVDGACIYSLGKMLISSSVFYNNNMDYDIRFLKGDLIGDTCMFADENNNNKLIWLKDTEYDLDYNYWGNKTIPVTTSNYLVGSIQQLPNNKVCIETTSANFDTEAVTRSFEKRYIIEVITNGD